MALNLGINLKSKLNPLGSLTQSLPVNQGPIAPTATGQDYLDSLKKHGQELQNAIDTHAASQTSSELPIFEINPAKATLNEFHKGLQTQPTGGGMMPPTPTQEPLPETPQTNVEEPKPEEPSMLIPSASAQRELSDDEIKQLISEGYSDDEIVKANEQLKTLPEEGPKTEEPLLDSLKLQSSESFAPKELGKDVFKFFANVPADSAQVVSGIWDAVTSPVKTTTGIVKTAKGLSDKAVYGIANAITRELGGKEVPPTEEAEMIDAIGSHIKEQYGTAGKFKKAVVENPADTLLTLMGGLSAASKIAEANDLTKVVDTINKVQEVINPVNILKQESKLITVPVKGALKLGSEVLGKTTGTSGETIRKAVELGGTEEFQNALRGSTTPQDILAATKEGLQAIKDNRSALYGEDYNILKANTSKLDISDVADEFANRLKDDYNINITKKGLDFSDSKITGTTSQSQIVDMYNDLRRWKDTTPAGLDILKQRLQDYFRGTEDSAKGDRLSTIASQAVKSKIVAEVPEYAKMTGTYEKLTNDIRDISKTLSLGDKAQAQTAITKLNSVLRDNFPARQDMVKLIESYTGKNLQGQIAGASLNPLLAKGLAGVIAGGGVITGQLANPAFWGGLLLASPRLIGETAAILGTSVSKLKSAITNISQYVLDIAHNSRSALEGSTQKVGIPALPSNKAGFIAPGKIGEDLSHGLTGNAPQSNNLKPQTSAPSDTKVNPLDLSKNKKGFIAPKKIGEDLGLVKKIPTELKTRKDFKDAVDRNDLDSLSSAHKKDPYLFNTFVEGMYGREKYDRLVSEITGSGNKSYGFIDSESVRRKPSVDYGENNYKASLLDKLSQEKVIALIKETEKNITKQENIAKRASESERNSTAVRVIGKNPGKRASLTARVENAFEMLDSLKEDLKFYKQYLSDRLNSK